MGGGLARRGKDCAAAGQPQWPVREVWLAQMTAGPGYSLATAGGANEMMSPTPWVGGQSETRGLHHKLTPVRRVPPPPHK